MPIYEFHCNKCNSSREVLQAFTAEAPLCCNLPMERHYSVIQKPDSFIKRFLRGDRDAIESERRYRDKRAAVDYEGK